MDQELVDASAYAPDRRCVCMTPVPQHCFTCWF